MGIDRRGVSIAFLHPLRRLRAFAGFLVFVARAVGLATVKQKVVEVPGLLLVLGRRRSGPRFVRSLLLPVPIRFLPPESDLRGTGLSPPAAGFCDAGVRLRLRETVEPRLEARVPSGHGFPEEGVRRPAPSHRDRRRDSLNVRADASGV
jgi:hypothetical protein